MGVGEPVQNSTCLTACGSTAGRGSRFKFKRRVGSWQLAKVQGVGIGQRAEVRNEEGVGRRRKEKGERRKEVWGLGVGVVC